MGKSGAAVFYRSLLTCLRPFADSRVAAIFFAYIEPSRNVSMHVRSMAETVSLRTGIARLFLLESA